MAFEAEQIAHLQEELVAVQRRSTTDTASVASNWRNRVADDVAADARRRL